MQARGGKSISTYMTKKGMYLSIDVKYTPFVSSVDLFAYCEETVGHRETNEFVERGIPQQQLSSFNKHLRGLQVQCSSVVLDFNNSCCRYLLCLLVVVNYVCALP